MGYRHFVTDWLDACSEAPRLSASSTTHQRCDHDETRMLLCCSPHKMLNIEDPVVEHSKRRQRLTPSRKQPPRGSAGSLPPSSQSGQARHIDSSRTPSLPPPADELEIDFVRLDLSSSARSETAVSTRLTSVSNHQ